MYKNTFRFCLLPEYNFLSSIVIGVDFKRKGHDGVKWKLEIAYFLPGKGIPCTGTGIHLKNNRKWESDKDLNRSVTWTMGF